MKILRILAIGFLLLPLAACTDSPTGPKRFNPLRGTVAIVCAVNPDTDKLECYEVRNPIGR